MKRKKPAAKRESRAMKTMKKPASKRESRAMKTMKTMKKPASKQYQASMKKPDLLAEESTKKPVSDEDSTKKPVSEKESMKLREDLLATIENDNVRAYWEVRAERHVPCSVVTNLKWRPTRKDLFQDNVQPQLTCKVLGVDMEFTNVGGYCHWQAAKGPSHGWVDDDGLIHDDEFGDGVKEGEGGPGGGAAASQGKDDGRKGEGKGGLAGEGGSGSSGSAANPIVAVAALPPWPNPRAPPVKER